MKPLHNANDLVLDPQNANRGTKRGRALLEKSLREYGAGRSILADKNGLVIAGNKTLETASALGLEVRVVETDGSELVVVQRIDLDLETDRAARELAYADNRVAELDLSWDVAQLEADLHAGFVLDAFFSPDELDALLEGGKVAEEPIPLDRVAPDMETAEKGQFLHFGKLKIPLTEAEVVLLNSALAQYREERGTYYGFVGSVLQSEEDFGDV